MRYRFPRLTVAIAAIPKTGCTSVLTFLLEAETRLGWVPSPDRRAVPGVLARDTASGDASDPTAIHVDGRLVDFVVDDAAAIAAGDLVIATVRNPVDRIASFWIDKMIDGPASWQLTYQDASWFPTGFRTVQALRAPFLAFLRALKHDRSFLESDPHWAPQAWLLRDWPAELIVPTPELDRLPELLGSRLPQASFLNGMSFPRLHSTHGWLRELLLSTQARQLALDVYREDAAWLEPSGCAFSSSGSSSEDAAELDERLLRLDREVRIRRSARLARALA